VDTLYGFTSGLFWFLTSVLILVAAGVAFVRKGPLLGAGLGLVAISSLFAWAFATFLMGWFMSVVPVVGGIDSWALLRWFWPINSIFAALGWLIVIVGLFKQRRGIR